MPGVKSICSHVKVKSKRLQATKAATKATAAAAAAAASAADGSASPVSMGPPSSVPDMDPASIQHLVEQEEVFRLRLDELRKGDVAVSSEREKLEKRKLLHIRELKRQRDEAQSQFNNCPRLGPSSAKYLLLDLLGKGGFSEVYRAFDLAKFEFVACKIHQLNNQV
eukprot:SAG31_NODE_275_length_18666_cov_8.489309_10_plen_166_part_00